MKTSNSNLKERRTSIGIASLLVLIPMLFAIMGTSLVKQADSVDGGKIKELETEIRNLEAQHLEFKNEQLAFYVEMNSIDSVFIVYRGLQQQYLMLKDSVNDRGIVSSIQKLENTYHGKVNQLERKLTNNSPFEQMQLNLLNQKRETFNMFKESIIQKELYNSCLSGTMGAEELQTEIDRLRRENSDLQYQLNRCGGETMGCNSIAIELDSKREELLRKEQELQREINSHLECQRAKEQLIIKKRNLIASYKHICETAKDNLESIKDIQRGLGLCRRAEMTNKIDETIREINDGMRDVQVP